MEKKYRVFNRCRYDIGVRLQNNITYNIKPGSFVLLDANDILYIETQCADKKFISQRMLVPVDEQNKEVDLSEFYIQKEEEAPVHMNEKEIMDMLKGTAKKIEAWLAAIEDEAELYDIMEVAKKMDLPASKLKLLQEKMPEKDVL